MIPSINIKSMIDGLEYTVTRTNKKVDYINLACGFDIETTSHKLGATKTAFMYIWALGIGHNNGVYYGRTWEEFTSVCQLLQDELQLSADRRLVVYVHNLGYEFQFMRRHFNWLNVFAVGERKPTKAICDYGIEFRDSYILSGFSLENTAKNLVTHKVKKMVGDLDYSLVRTHLTPLTETEMKYCENDIAVITAYVTEQIEMYGDVTKIPMTNTGRVRKHVRHECYYTDTNHRKSSKSKYIRYRKIMNDLTIDTDTYIQLKRAFMGGFTHANANYSGKTLENVSSIDFTSSYPSVMISEKFPMSRFRPAEITSIKELEEYCAKYAVVFDVSFINFRCKITQETYLSESKCSKIVSAVLNNGRIVNAEEIATTITETDYDIIKQVYEWDNIAVRNVRYAHKNYLPKSIIQSVLDLYKDKTVLKDVEGSEVEYMLSKGMLNSIYGMCVTDIVKDNAVYGESWEVEKVDIEAEIESYNTSKNRFLYYAWGLWVTAYARRNLWTGIISAGNDYVYSDTDSLKILNYEKHKPYIKWFDTQMVKKMELMCEHYKFDKEMLAPKTKDGKVKIMGVWDFEGTYSRFKTLGAKRYLTQSGDKLHLTVAGLSKQNGIKYMLELAGGDKAKVFDMFTDTLYIPADRTGKMTHTYIDDEASFKVTDYLGVETRVTTMSGVHLESCDFTLSIAGQYKEFLTNLANGYIYKGVKHI
jgi:hypothetical protein